MEFVFVKIFLGCDLFHFLRADGLPADLPDDDLLQENVSYWNHSAEIYGTVLSNIAAVNCRNRSVRTVRTASELWYQFDLRRCILPVGFRLVFEA